jgi:hypothetical protein
MIPASVAPTNGRTEQVHMIRHDHPSAQAVLNLIVKEKRLLNHLSDIKIPQVTFSAALIEVDLNALSHQ